LLKAIKSLKELREETLKKLKKIEEEIEIKDTILVQDKKFDDILIEKYNEAKNEIFHVYKLLEKDETPVLNLDKVKDFIIEFSKLNDVNDVEVKDVKTEKDDVKDVDFNDVNFNHVDINDKIIVLSNNDEKIPLRFKNGKKIILTKKLFDLSVFTHDELVEILRFLDLIIVDNSYDYLRSEIVKEISSISSISQIK